MPIENNTISQEVSPSKEDKGPVSPQVTSESIVSSRIHINEFLARHPELSEMRVCAFKAVTFGKVWMRLNEWEEEFKKFNEK